MEENRERKVAPFDSFAAVHKAIFLAGYSKLDKRAKTWQKILYEIYRRLALSIVIVYNLQFLIYTFQVSVQFNMNYVDGSRLQLLSLS